MSKAYSTRIERDGYGYYLEVYADDDGASGYGDNPKRGRWYGSREECKAVDPAVVELFPLGEPENDAAYASGYAYACGYHD